MAPRVPLKSVEASSLATPDTRILMWAKRRAGGGYEVTEMSPAIAGRTSPPLPYSRIAVRAVPSTNGGSVSLTQWSGPM
jgi:hypothetical protein